LPSEPNSQSDIAGGEGDGRGKGNAAPHKQDDAEGLVNALSDNEEETVGSIDKDPSPCPSQARSSDQIDNHRDEFDRYSARSDDSGRRRAKRKRPSSSRDDLTKKRKH